MTTDTIRDLLVKAEALADAADDAIHKTKDAPMWAFACHTKADEIATLLGVALAESEKEALAKYTLANKPKRRRKK